MLVGGTVKRSKALSSDHSRIEVGRGGLTASEHDAHLLRIRTDEETLTKKLFILLCDV